MKHSIIPPPLQLSQYVKCFWAFEVDQMNNKQWQISTFVNDSSGITILVEKSHAIFKAMVQGQFTRPEIYRPVTSITVFGVIFHPQAISSLFGMHAASLTDCEISLNDIAGWNIADAIFNEPDLQKQIGILAGFLIQLTRNTYPADTLITHCMHHIQASKGLVTVGGLKDQYAVSERQLERRFMAAIGVSPRHYLKITRFREALQLIMHRDTVKLVDIAHALNYADQAHFVRHVKQLSGLTPTALHKKITSLPVNLSGGTHYLVSCQQSNQNQVPDHQLMAS